MSRSTRTRAGATAALLAAVVAAPLVGLPAAPTLAAPAKCAAPTRLSVDDGPSDVRVGAYPRDTALHDVVLTWDGVAGVAPTYDVQISANESFTNNLALSVSGIRGSRFVPDRRTIPHGSYWWRVRTSGAHCWSDDGPAAPGTFSTAWLARPQPLEPANGSTIAPDALRFTWKPIAGAGYYELELSHDPGFPEHPYVQGARTSTLTCFTNNTSWSPYDIPLGELNSSGPQPIVAEPCPDAAAVSGTGTWFWRVRGFDPLGELTLAGTPQKTLYAGGIGHEGLAGTATSSVTVTSVSPSSGPSDGGTQLRVTGTGFTTDGTAVSVGGRAAKDVKVLSGTRLVATTPAGTAGAAPVIVTTAEGSSVASTSSTFTYIDPPAAGATAPGGSAGSGAGAAGTAPAPAASGAPAAGPAPAPAAGASSRKTDEVGSWGPSSSYVVGSGGAIAGTTVAAPQSVVVSQPDPTGALQPCAVGTAGVVEPAQSPPPSNPQDCTTTATIGWSRSASASGAQATGYRVYIATDPEFSDIKRVYETTSTSLTPRESLLDSQAGRAYWIAVQSCWIGACGDYTVTAVRKSSLPVAGVRQLSASDDSAVLVGWDDYARSTGAAQEAAGYHLQVAPAETCDFSTPVLDLQTDAPEASLPVPGASGGGPVKDGKYVVRVQAVDASGSPLTWGPGPGPGTSDCGALPVTVDHSTRTVAATSSMVAQQGRWQRRTLGRTQMLNGKPYAELALPFHGATVSVQLCQGPRNGRAAVYLDGRLVQTVSTSLRYSRCGQLPVTVAAVPDRDHVLMVRSVPSGRTGLSVSGFTSS